MPIQPRMEQRQASLLSRIRPLFNQVLSLQSHLPFITCQIFCALGTVTFRIKYEWHHLPNKYKACAFVSIGFLLPLILLAVESFGRHGAAFSYYWFNYFAAAFGAIDRMSKCSNILKEKGPASRFAENWQLRFRRGCEGHRDGLLVQGHLVNALLEGIMNTEDGLLAMATLASRPTTVLQWTAVLGLWVIIYDFTVLSTRLSFWVINWQYRFFVTNFLTSPPGENIPQILWDVYKNIWKGQHVSMVSVDSGQESPPGQDQQADRENLAPTQPPEPYEDAYGPSDFDTTDRHLPEAFNILAHHELGSHPLDNEQIENADDVLWRQSQSVLFKAMRDLRRMGFGVHPLGREDEFRGEELHERLDHGISCLLNHEFDIFGFENDVEDEKEQNIMREAISIMNKHKLKISVAKTTGIGKEGLQALQFLEKTVKEHAEEPLQVYPARFDPQASQEQLYQPYRPPESPTADSQVAEDSHDLDREDEARLEPILNRSSWQRYGQPPIPEYPGETSQEQNQPAMESPLGESQGQGDHGNEYLEETEVERERSFDTDDQIQGALDLLYSVRPMDFEDATLQRLRLDGFEVGNYQERGYVRPPYSDLEPHVFELMVELARKICERNWIPVAPWHVQDPRVIERYWEGNRLDNEQLQREIINIDPSVDVEGQDLTHSRDDENGVGEDVNTRQTKEENLEKEGQALATNDPQEGGEALMPLHKALQDALDTLIRIGSIGFNLNYVNARGFEIGNFERRGIKRQTFEDRHAEKVATAAAVQLLWGNGVKLMTQNVELEGGIFERAVQDAIYFLYDEGVRWQEPILGNATAHGWQMGHLEERGLIKRPVEDRYFLQAMTDALDIVGLNGIHPFQDEAEDERVMEDFLNEAQANTEQGPLQLSRRFQQNFLNLLFSRLRLPDFLIEEWQGLGFIVGDLEEQDYEPPLFEQDDRWGTRMAHAIEDAIVFLRIKVPRYIYADLRELRTNSYPWPLTQMGLDSALAYGNDEIAQRMRPGGPRIQIEGFRVPSFGLISQVRDDGSANEEAAIPEHPAVGPIEEGNTWRWLPVGIAGPEFYFQDMEFEDIAFAEGRRSPHGAAGFFSPYALPPLGEEEEEEER